MHDQGDMLSATEDLGPAFDLALPFQLETLSLRGRLVRLGRVLDVVLQQHAYPDEVSRLLGEAMVIAGALGTSLKYDGVFTLQTKTDGPIGLLVADVTGDGGMRACAKFNDEALATAQAGALLGQGYLAFTVDQQAVTDRYQGIVKLERDALDEAIQHYFRQSEQIPTGLVIGVRRDEAGHWWGGCLLLQRMPREGGHAGAEPTYGGNDCAVEDDWLRAMMLLRTCTVAELTDPSLRPEALLYRLFHEDGVRVYAPKLLQPQCRCSQERVAEMVASLPAEDVAALIVDGRISVTCAFCNQSYHVAV